MKNPASTRYFHGPVRSSQNGSTLVASVLTVLVLSLVAANVLTSISARYNSAYRSAGWNEALLAAESGVDVTVSEVFRLVPNVSMSPGQGIGVGYSQPPSDLRPTLITGLQFSPSALLLPGGNATALTFNAPVLPGTDQQASIALDVVPLSTLLAGGPTGLLGSVSGALNGGDLNLLRIRSTGTVSLPGGTVAGPSRLDNDLWRPSLITDRNTGKAVDAPGVSRQVEAILRPVYPFESAVVSNDRFSSTDAGAIFDSFNSTQDTSSTNNQYDSLKRRTNGTIRSNASSLTVNGSVYGGINTNGGSVVKTPLVTGAVNNAAFTPLPLVNAPTWTGTPVSTNVLGLVSVPLTSVTGSTILPAGTLVPLQYKFNGISGSLHITRGALNPGNVEIYINGDLTGSIEIDPGVTAKIYVSGSVNTNASQLKNDSLRATNLQIYGVPGTPGISQSIKINMDANLAAAIYAPGDDVTLSGVGDYSGTIVGNVFQAIGAVRVHYDEALAASVGPLLRFEIASWKEITN